MGYVTDIESNELVYMNQKPRESMGFPFDKQYIGKLYYEVLRGKDGPCAFCTNCNLKKENFSPEPT